MFQSNTALLPTVGLHVCAYLDSVCTTVPSHWPHPCPAGGSVPVFDEVVLSTSLMNQVISLDQTAGGHDSRILIFSVSSSLVPRLCRKPGYEAKSAAILQ